MKRSHFAAAFALMLSACGGNVHNTEAIRQGIVDHLAARKNLDLDMSAMDVQVTSVAFRENEADATVSFKPKGAAAGSPGMSMRYTLERKGNQWVVKTKAETGANPHGAGGAAPQESAPGQLPPGHPPVQQPPPPPPPK